MAKVSPRKGEIGYTSKRKPKQIKAKGNLGGSVSGPLPRKFDNMEDQALYQAKKQLKKRGI